MGEEEPKVKELTEEEAAAAENPENVAEEVEEEEEDESPSSGRQNRNEKKARKAMQKLGLKAFPGVKRVTVKRGGQNLFIIAKPDVMKHPTSETYIVFGEASLDDSQNQMAQVARQFAGAGDAAAAAGTANDDAPAVEEEDDDDEEDDPKLEAGDIELIMKEANVSKKKAKEALKKNEYDVVNAIMDLAESAE